MTLLASVVIVVLTSLCCQLHKSIFNYNGTQNLVMMINYCDGVCLLTMYNYIRVYFFLHLKVCYKNSMICLKVKYNSLIMLPPSPLLPELSLSDTSYCSISSHALLDLIDNHGPRSNRLYNIHITHTHLYKRIL